MPDVSAPEFDRYVLNGRVYSNLDVIPLSRREMIDEVTRQERFDHTPREGQALILSYDADRVFPLETHTDIPTRLLLRLFDVEDLEIFNTNRLVWENEPPIPRPDHERLLAALVWTHLLPDNLPDDDRDDLERILYEVPERFFSKMERTRTLDGTPLLDTFDFYRHADGSAAVCPPCTVTPDHPEAEVVPLRELDDRLRARGSFALVRRPTSPTPEREIDVDEPDAAPPGASDSPKTGSGPSHLDAATSRSHPPKAANGNETASPPDASETRSRAGAEPDRRPIPETEAEPRADAHPEPAKRKDSVDSDSDTESALILVGQLILLILGLAAIGYAAISLL